MRSTLNWPNRSIGSKFLKYQAEYSNRPPDAFATAVDFTLEHRLLPSAWLNGILYVHTLARPVRRVLSVGRSRQNGMVVLLPARNDLQNAGGHREDFTDHCRYQRRIVLVTLPEGILPSTFSGLPCASSLPLRLFRRRDGDEPEHRPAPIFCRFIRLSMCPAGVLLPSGDPSPGADA